MMPVDRSQRVRHVRTLARNALVVSSVCWVLTLVLFGAASKAGVLSLLVQLTGVIAIAGGAVSAPVWFVALLVERLAARQDESGR